MNQRKLRVLEQLYHRRPQTLAAALPRIFSRGVGGLELQKWITAVAVTLAILAAVSYVVAVNTIFFDGEAIRQGNSRIRALEHNDAEIERAILERQSPAWLADQSRANGMVAVGTVRYLVTDPSFALSR